MPAIEVSCPSCGEINVVEMKIIPIRESITKILSSFCDSKNYHFDGEKLCSKCGEQIEVILTVGNRPKQNVASLFTGAAQWR
jgi:phage FluMu protein Com